jgi:hypothetical protein
MIANSISGVSINAYLPTLFKEFEEERCYLTFARGGNTGEKRTWGTCALVHISLKPTEKLSNILPNPNDGGAYPANRFIDKMCANYNPDKPEDTIVRLYKTDGSVPDFDEDMTKYSAIVDTALQDTDIFLEHINNHWCLLNGLPSDYFRFMNNDNGEKYYIVSKQTINNLYPEHPSTSVKMVKINVNSAALDFTSIIEQVTLWVHDTRDNLNHVDTPVVHNLSRTTNILGEKYITGIPTNFDYMFPESDLVGMAYYQNQPIGSDPNVFSLRNVSNAVVSESLYLMKYENLNGDDTVWYYDSIGKKYLLFKNIGPDPDNNVSYMKVSQDIPPTGLAIFHESLPFAFPTINSSDDVSDKNPPSSSMRYLKNSAFHKSLIEILGYVKIKKSYNPNSVSPDEFSSKITYCRELTDMSRNATESKDKQKYLALGFVENDPTATKRFETITVTSPTPIYRLGNVRPTPNGVTEYGEGARRLYMWTNDFIVGDRVIIKLDPTDPFSGTISRSITSINYTNNYIVIDAPVGIGNTLFASVNNSQLTQANAQVVTDTTNANNVISVTEYAVCDNYDDALFTEMDSVMIDIKIPTSGEGLYTGIYRQLAIVYDPSVVIYDDNGVGTLTKCNKFDTIYYKTNMSPIKKVDLFNDGINLVNHAYEPGTILYLANKQPIYRNMIGSRETFKLII